MPYFYLLSKQFDVFCTIFYQILTFSFINDIIFFREIYIFRKDLQMNNSKNKEDEGVTKGVAIAILVVTFSNIFFFWVSFFFTKF